jgi:hypothetical protein
MEVLSGEQVLIAGLSSQELTKAVPYSRDGSFAQWRWRHFVRSNPGTPLGQHDASYQRQLEVNDQTGQSQEAAIRATTISLPTIWNQPL